MSHLHLIWGVNFACPKLNCCGVISTIHPDLNEAELYSRVRVTFCGGHLPEGKGSRPPDLLGSGEGAGGQNPKIPPRSQDLTATTFMISQGLTKRVTQPS